MSDPDPARTFREALSTGDLEAVLEAHRTLDERTVEELLSDLADAVSSGRYEDAESLLVPLTERYRSRRGSERETLAATEAARRAADTELSQSLELSEYRRQAIDLKANRSKALSATEALLRAPDDPATPEPATVESTIRSTRDAEQSFASRTETVESGLSGITVPATVSVVGLSASEERIQVGDSTTLSVVLANVGDETATDVTVEVTAPPALSVGRTPISVPELVASDRRTETTSVTASESGTVSLTVTASGTDATGSVRTLSLSVDSDPGSGPVDRADTNDDGAISTAELQTAIREWAAGGYTTRDLQLIIQAWARDG